MKKKSNFNLIPIVKYQIFADVPTSVFKLETIKRIEIRAVGLENMIGQGMIDGSASKPALRQDTGYMIEKTYLNI